MRLLLAVLVLASCAKEVEELGDFPCPANKECPDGRVCAHDMCVIPELGTECHADFTDSCAAGTAATGCFELDPITNTGRCEHACSSSAQCESGTCSSANGICLDDCSADPVGCGIGRECVLRAPDQMHCVAVGAPGPNDICSTDSQCQLRDASAFCFKAVPQALDGVCSIPCTVEEGCLPSAAGARSCVVDNRGILGCVLACAGSCDPGYLCAARGPGPSQVCVLDRLRAAGQHCNGPKDCASGNCGASDGQKRCTVTCSSDQSCQPGFACFKEEGSFGACWPQSNASAGCTTSRSGTLWMTFVVLLVVGRRRR